MGIASLHPSYAPEILLQPRKVAAQPRHREIHEGTHLRHREPALRHDHMHRQRGGLVAREHDFEFAVPHLVGHLIGIKQRHAAPADRRRHRSTGAVDHEPRRKLNGSRDGGARRRRKTPGIGDVRHRNDLVLGQIARLLDARILLEITRRSHHHPAHLPDPGRDHRQVGQLADAERGIEAFVDQVHRPIEQQEARGHRRVGVQEGIEDRS